MLALAYVVTASGRLLLAAAGAHDAGLGTAYVLGLLTTCLVVYALSALMPLTAGAAFGVVAAATLVADIATARRRPTVPPDWRSLAAFALCVAFTAAWTSGPAAAYDALRTDGVFRAWGDYFFHGALISQLGDVRMLGRGSILLADHPSSFYHFASYLSAAPLSGILDQPGLQLAVSIWLPLGFLAMTASACALGERLAGAAGGLAALAAVAILPDASTYGLRNGLFSFHWSLLAIAGATYALGAALLSVVFLDRWSEDRSSPAMWLSALLVASCVVFRAHLFVLHAPAWLATVALCATPPRHRSRIALLVLAALGMGAATVSLLLTHLSATDPEFWRFSGRALGPFLTQIHGAQEPTAYTGVYDDLASKPDSGFALTAGIVLAYVAALGVFVVLLPVAHALARHRDRLRPIDAFPAFVACCWLLLMLFAPVPWLGDPTELTHRPFVLLYAVATVWTLCLAIRGVVARMLWPMTLALCLFALPAVMVGAAGMAWPKPDWAQSHATHRLEPGLLEAAAFLRRQAVRPGDTFAVAGLSDELAVVDVAAQLASLSGLPAYLARPYLEMIKDAPRKAVVTARLAALREIDRQTDYAAAAAMLQHIGVRWYVVTGEQGPRWDPARRHAAFVARSVGVYAAGAAH